jgi:hypothetical protein
MRPLLCGRAALSSRPFFPDQTGTALAEIKRTLGVLPDDIERWNAEQQSKSGSMAVYESPCYISGLAAKDHNICDGQAVNP